MKNPPTGEGATEEEEAAPSGDYEAVIRPAQQRWRIGYGDGLSGIPFTDSVTDNINAIAEEMGVDIIYCDNAYDQEKTVECSNLLITQEVDGVIFANWIAGTEDLISGIFHDAGVPCVSYDGPHPGCVAFGPDNYEAGVAAGRFLAQLCNGPRMESRRYRTAVGLDSRRARSQGPGRWHHRRRSGVVRHSR